MITHREEEEEEEEKKEEKKKKKEEEEEEKEKKEEMTPMKGTVMFQILTKFLNLQRSCLWQSTAAHILMTAGNN
ncbi:UNVERIFIED_CONTAM: hypothetical protein FKN15_037509 [Acipenser sinensis]